MFFHLPIDGHLGCLKVLTVMNKTFINVHMKVCLFVSHERFYMDVNFNFGFPSGSAGKETVCNVGDLSSIPGLGRFPWRRE